MNRCALLIPGLILSSISGAALAHHSRAEFTGDVIELEGELIQVEWINPHPYFTLRLSDSSADVWEIQLYGSAASLGRAGIDATLFPVGERITVAGLASRRRENFLLGSHALLPSDLEVVLQYNAGPHWSGEHIGGSGGEVIDENALAKAAQENRGIFRFWSVSSTEAASAAFVNLRSQLTEPALAALEELFDIPIGTCGRPPMPWMMATPIGREFIDNGSTLTLRIGYLAGASRMIHLGEEPTNVIATRSAMGRSLGRWEGNTLVVETDLITPPSPGVQSSDMNLTERFTLSDDQSRLDYELVMNDLVAFEGSATFRLQYLALGEEYLPQCETP